MGTPFARILISVRCCKILILLIWPTPRWIKGAFDLRAAQREKEKKGLREAQAMLAGAHDFVQAKHANIGFLRKVTLYPDENGKISTKLHIW